MPILTLYNTKKLKPWKPYLFSKTFLQCLISFFIHMSAYCMLINIRIDVDYYTDNQN